MSTLGDILRSARQRQGISLAEAEAATKVHRKYLAALEEGSYDQLPAKVYGKGFLRSYADLLDLDKDELLRILESEWPDAHPFTVQPETKHVSMPSTLTGGTIVVLLVILGVGFFGYYLYQQYALYARTSRATPASALQLAATQTPLARQNPSPGPTAIRSPTPPTPVPVVTTPRSDQITVETKIVERSWLRVTTDDKLVFEGSLPEGTTQTWVAMEKIVVRTGNGAGVEVAVNGKKQGLMGSRGEVLEKQWTRP
ncbi:MAG: helix-turn-helix domain-containing protein [Chloroflexi bacterium]|nr:helix-turn-helix domain-containing protein [Chloroflexota bacterium]